MAVERQEAGGLVRYVLCFQMLHTLLGIVMTDVINISEPLCFLLRISVIYYNMIINI